MKDRITYNSILLRRAKAIAHIMYAIDEIISTTEHGHVNDIEALISPSLRNFFCEVFGLAREDDVVCLGDIEGIEERRVLVVEPWRVEGGHSGYAGGCHDTEDQICFIAVGAIVQKNREVIRLS